MKNYLTLLLLLVSSAASLCAQNLYDPNVIQEIKITFGFSNWDYRLDTANAASGSYVIAQSLEVNGQVFDSVGVKFKGNSSYSANNAKNPLHIELNTVRNNQDYQGYTDIKLGNGFSDPSFVREPLSYWVLSHYMDVPQANFAKVWINGAYYGLMNNAEHIGKDFADNHFYSSDGTLVKCNPVGGAGPGSSASPNLVWKGADTTLYYSSYEIKSDYGWGELRDLIDTLNNQSAAIDQILDVDRTLWMLAFNDLLVNLDSYTGAFAQNYYLYRAKNGRFNPVVWDLNMSFGGFPMLGSTGGGGAALDSTAMKNLIPLVQATNAQRPLIQKLLANPTYQRMYLAHLRTMLSEMFATGTYLTKGQEWQTLIDQAVEDDANKFYTYQKFQQNLYLSVAGTGGGGGGGFGGSIVGIRALMNGRLSFLNSNSLISATAPTVGNVVHSANPALDEQVWVTAQVSGANTTSVLLGWRNLVTDVFTRIQMFDDGQHQDGASGDGTYGAAIVPQSPQVQFYVYAENANAGVFSPARAEHEFYHIDIELVTPEGGSVVVNEILADNVNGDTDPAGEHEDWVELFNNTESEINLTGLYLSDNPEVPAKWAFPAGTVIPAHGFVVVWADEDASQSGLHANFKLKAGGEFVGLATADGTWLDSLSFGEQVTDRSWGRYPNGTGPFVEMPTTIGAVNSLTSGVSGWVMAESASLQVAPNPVDEELQVALQGFDNEAVVLKIYDAQNRLLHTQTASGANVLRVPVADWAAGLYVVQVQSAHHSVTTRVVK